MVLRSPRDGRYADPAGSAAMTPTPACGRSFFHVSHDITKDGLAVRCPGAPGHSRNLAELLARRPELTDLTTVTVINRIQVMCA